MGLSNLVAMSDSDAMEIRGMGYQSGGHSNGNYGKKGAKTSVKASGRSWAEVELDGHKVEGDAGSSNRYDSEGKYYASGRNGSEAQLEKTYTTRVDYPDGDFMIETKTIKVKVQNADLVPEAETPGHTIQLTAGDGDCPVGTVNARASEPMAADPTHHQAARPSR